MSETRSYCVLLKSGGSARYWIVSAYSPRDAKKHARRQVEQAFGGRWRVESVGLATPEVLRMLRSFRSGRR